MKTFFYLFILFSFSSYAGIKEDLKENIAFCQNLTKDPTKLEMVKGEWALTQSYIAQINVDEKIMRRQMVCDVGLAFNQGFEKNHQPKFEIRNKKRLSLTEIEAIRNDLLVLVHNDKPEARKKAFMGKWPGVEQYFNEKMKELIDRKK